MQITDIESFIKSLEITVPDDKEFLKLSKSTPMNPEGKITQLLNYERGILLYALIAKYKPQNVLEIGTAKGYSTLCMAWAMHDHNIPGTIYTIDPSLDTKFKIKINDEINLELPLKFSQNISGHICQGHVDTVCKVKNIKKIDKSFVVEFKITKKFK